MFCSDFSLRSPQQEKILKARSFLLRVFSPNRPTFWETSQSFNKTKMTWSFYWIVSCINPLSGKKRMRHPHVPGFFFPNQPQSTHIFSKEKALLLFDVLKCRKIFDSFTFTSIISSCARPVTWHSAGALLVEMNFHRVACNVKTVKLGICQKIGKFWMGDFSAKF